MLSSIDGFFPDVPAAHIIVTNAAPYHQRCRLLNCPQITSGWSLSSHPTGHGVRGFHKELQMLIRLTTDQFSTLTQTILDELWSTEDGPISGWCSHMASSLRDTALSCICGLDWKLCSQTVISGGVSAPTDPSIIDETITIDQWSIFDKNYLVYNST